MILQIVQRLDESPRQSAVLSTRDQTLSLGTRSARGAGMNTPESLETLESDIATTESTKPEPKKLSLERTVVRRMLTIKNSTVRAGCASRMHGPKD